MIKTLDATKFKGATSVVAIAANPADEEFVGIDKLIEVGDELPRANVLENC